MTRPLLTPIRSRMGQLLAFLCIPSCFISVYVGLSGVHLGTSCRCFPSVSGVLDLGPRVLVWYASHPCRSLNQQLTAKQFTQQGHGVPVLQADPRRQLWIHAPSIGILIGEAWQHPTFKAAASAWSDTAASPVCSGWALQPDHPAQQAYRSASWSFEG